MRQLCKFINYWLLGQTKQEIEMIPNQEITYLDRNPDPMRFAIGTFADVYRCKWNNSKVALKVLRINPNPYQTEEIKHEASLGLKLRHPSIVQLFGLTQLGNNFLGIVMEWTDQGTLGKKMDDHQVSISSTFYEQLLHP
jgi:serine/threonine protein kinase